MKLFRGRGTAGVMRALFVGSLVLLGGCNCVRETNVGEVDGGSLPTTLTLSGRVCSRRVDPASFVTKVALVIDQRGGICVLDPPGSQATSGFCETHAPAPAGVTVPARVRAAQALVAQLATTPNVQLALVPFDTNVRGAWPNPNPGNVRFARPDPTLDARLASLQSELGNASDLEGALAWTHALIASDMAQLSNTAPELLPRTRYVVIVIKGGPPSPRCAANDALEVYADDVHPELTWPDSSLYCNSADPQEPDPVVGFVAGTARNQNVALFEYVRQMNDLVTHYRAGELRLHTVLLTNSTAITDCGPICQDLFGPWRRWPGPVAVPLTENAEFVRRSTKWLMTELATRGGGVSVEFAEAAGLATASLSGFDTNTLAAHNTLKRLLVQPARAVAEGGAWVPDSDGDGVSDAVEATQQTNPLAVDTDGDGFDDDFELAHGADGFNPLTQDERGCNATLPNCVVRDVDGDGLSQFAESYLGTSPIFVDSDRDGFPDGFEVRAGLSPVDALGSSDSDADGVSDVEELLRGSDVLQADRAFSDAEGIATSIVAEPANADGSTCYTVTVRNVPLAATPAWSPTAPRPVPATPAGLNLVKVWFATAPHGLDQDVGEWTTACAWARRDGETLVPADLSLEVPSNAFIATTVPFAANACVGFAATSP